MPVYDSVIFSGSNGLQLFLITALCGDPVGEQKHRHQANPLVFGGVECSVVVIMDGASSGFKP